MIARVAGAVAALALLAAAPAPNLTPVDRVHVFAGTSNSRWQLFPGATVPFGMVKLSPDNQGNVWNGGYEYTVASIAGFSHLHAMGLSGLSLMPVVGPLQIDPTSSRFHAGAADGPFGGMWTAGYRSRIDKASETGSPGYYGVTLLDYGVKAELSATTRVGYMRLTWPKTTEGHLFVDLDFPTEEQATVIATDFAQVGPAAFEGHVRQRNQYAGTHDYWFRIELSKMPRAVRTWTNGDYTGPDTNYGTAWRRPVTLAPLPPGGFHGGARTGVVLDYATADGEVLTVRSAISFVDAAGARANMAAETAGPGWDFARVVADARWAWAKRLGAIAVSDEAPARADTFYTALYRTFAGKSILSDADGRYRDFRGDIARLAAPADAVYSSDALWGAQWDLAPLWTLAAPDVAVSYANGLLALADRGGWIPAAPVNLRYSPIMVAQHQDALIVSAVTKRLPGVDGARAFRAMRHDLMTQGTPLADGQYAGNRQLNTYVRHGFVPDSDGPTSNTFEYAFDDACMAALATVAGHPADAAAFARRARSWMNAIDPATGYARPRNADGTWISPFDPTRFGTVGGWNGRGFVEGTAWTYSWWVPHDVPGLVKHVGRERFLSRLEAGFADGSVDLTNEPGLIAPFLFAYAGQPWRTQYWTRRIVDENYDTSPYKGWAGEEDEGQLTAYYALLAMGLFEVDGGCSATPGYDLTSPAFRRTVIHLGPGRDLRIEADGPPGAVYIQSASFDGRPLTRAWIAHATIAKGGTLHLTLGTTPNERWGTTGEPR